MPIVEVRLERLRDEKAGLAMLTRKQLAQFAANGKDGFESGAMFYAAIEEAGFEPGDLGKSRKFMIDDKIGHHWRPKTDKGFVDLVEFERKVFLEGEMNRETLKMFSLLRKAVYE